MPIFSPKYSLIWSRGWYLYHFPHLAQYSYKIWRRFMSSGLMPWTGFSYWPYIRIQMEKKMQDLTVKKISYDFEHIGPRTCFLYVPYMHILYPKALPRWIIGPDWAPGRKNMLLSDKWYMVNRWMDRRIEGQNDGTSRVET